MKLLEKDWFKKEDNKMDNATKAISSLLCAAMHKNTATMEVFDEEYEAFKSTDILFSSLPLTIIHLQYIFLSTQLHWLHPIIFILPLYLS